jgi:hypothetical protein
VRERRSRRFRYRAWSENATLSDSETSEDGCVAVTEDRQSRVPPRFWLYGFVCRSDKRYLAANLFSVILVGRAVVSLVFFAKGGDVDTNPNAIPTLIVISAAGTLIAFGSLTLSVSLWWRTTRPARWRGLKLLWVLCAVLLLIEWTVTLGSSG